MSTPTPAPVRISRWYRAPLPETATVVDNLKDILPERNHGGGEIDRLGLGPEIVRLRKAGLTQDEVALELKLSRHQVQHWLEKYNSLEAAAQTKVKTRSIFDMSDRLQETFERLETMLMEIKGENRELEVKILDKILKAIGQAGVLVEKIELYKDNQRFKEVVLELLDQEAPGIKAKALRRLSEHREGIGALRPLN